MVFGLFALLVINEGRTLNIDDKLDSPFSSGKILLFHGMEIVGKAKLYRQGVTGGVDRHRRTRVCIS